MLSDLRQRLRFDSAFWRKLAWYGSARGPTWWLKASPPGIGLLFAALLPRQRSAVRANLRTILGRRAPIEENLDVARTFMGFAQTLADGLALSGGDRYHPSIEVVGADHFESAIAGGAGAILATAHTAGWETAVSALRERHPAPVLVVMHHEPDAKAGALHDSWRKKLGFEIVHAGEDPMSSLPLLRHLRDGGLVAVQLDRCPAGMRCRSTTLLGHPWQVPEGPFRLASLTGCPIVPVFSERTGFLSYRLTLRPPIRVPKPADDRAIDEAVSVAVGELAAFVSAHPTQWFQFA